MSDVPEGPGWWRASDGRWYPPQGAAAPPPPVGAPTGGPGGPPPAPAAPPPGPGPVAPGSWSAGPVDTAAAGPGPGGYPPPAVGPGGYPATPGHGPGGYPVPSAPRPSQGMHGCLIAFLVVLAVGAVLGIGSCVVLVAAVDEASDDIATDLAESDADERDDVSEPRCSTDSVGDLQAEVDVTNDSSERSSYSIEVAFEAPSGDQITTGLGGVSALEPGQSTVATVITVTDAPADFTCRVIDVQRLSDVP